ncbi:MAG: hypothetical protein IIY03_00905, partial [Muribaculaceae bacterium]|nr:hypothetical protein [Muribaculaceae bacterium]
IDLSSKNTSIDCMSDVKESALKAYIVNGELRVSLAEEDQPYSLEVVSLDGRVLESRSNISSIDTRIDLSHLNGFAIVKVRQGNNSCVAKAVL